MIPLTTRALCHAYRNLIPEVREDGLTWYQTENTWALDVAQRSAADHATVLGVLAVLSPRAHWEVVKTLVESALVDDDWRWDMFYSRNQQKASALIGGARFEDVVSPVTSPKVYNFYHCLQGSTTHVCLDTWQAYLHGLTLWRAKSYREAVPVYQRAAERLGVLPAQLQASLWVHTRAGFNSNQYRLTFGETSL